MDCSAPINCTGVVGVGFPPLLAPHFCPAGSIVTLTKRNTGVALSTHPPYDCRTPDASALQQLHPVYGLVFLFKYGGEKEKRKPISHEVCFFPLAFVPGSALGPSAPPTRCRCLSSTHTPDSSPD